ncbi:MAG: type I secretion protein [Rhodobacteraceae bacterium]|nr:type I secretion protein [Paracoccaceae bacterium]
MTFEPYPKSISQNPYVDAHFGGNFLATTDRLGDQGTFDEAVAALGITALRAPGGALTEQNLGILTPDTGQIIDRDTGEPIDVLPVSELNSYAEDAGLSVTYVVPTRVFVGEETDANGDRFAAIDEDALRQFVSDVADGSLGGAPEVQAFEIGNEYWGAGEMSAVEYGRVASEMATIIDDQLTKLPNADRFAETDIIVQMGTNYGSSNLSNAFEGTASEQLAAINETYGLSLDEDKFIYSSGDVAWAKVSNEILLNEFDAEARDAIDGVVSHVYSRGADVPNSRYFELSQVQDTWLQQMPDLDIYATEWNLKRTIDPTREEEYGLKQAHEMLNIMEAFDWAGVDAAHVWPVQMDSRTGLTSGEGDETVDLAGEMFRMMQDTLPGTRPLDLEGSRGRETEIEGDTADVHTFWADDRMVTYLASTSGETTEQIVDFQQLVSDTGDMAITRLGVAPGANPTGADTQAVVTQENSDDLMQDGMLITDLAPYEIMMIEMSNPTYTDAVQAQAAALPEDGEDLPTTDPDDETDPEATPDPVDGGGGVGGEIGLLLALGALPLLFMAG